MSKNVHGIESILFQKAPGTGVFPTKYTPGENCAKLTEIAIDSFQRNQEEDQVEEVEVEETDAPLLVLTQKKGDVSFQIETYNLSDESLKYFLGYVDGTEGNNGWKVKPVSFEMPLQAMQVISRPINGQKGRVDEYMPVKVSAKIDGTQGKKNLVKLTLKCTLVANKGTKGEELPNHRYKENA